MACGPNSQAQIGRQANYQFQTDEREVDLCGGRYVLVQPEVKAALIQYLQQTIANFYGPSTKVAGLPQGYLANRTLTV